MHVNAVIVRHAAAAQPHYQPDPLQSTSTITLSVSQPTLSDHPMIAITDALPIERAQSTTQSAALFCW